MRLTAKLVMNYLTIADIVSLFSNLSFAHILQRIDSLKFLVPKYIKGVKKIRRLLSNMAL